MRWRRRSEELPLTALERRTEGISAYLDDELSDADLAEIEALLAEDAEARDSLDDLRLLTTALASMGEIRAPRSFAIPATGAVAPGSIFRRMELGIRVSAAAAALFFVVALVNQPAGMTAGTFSMEAATSAEDSMAATTAMDARQTADDTTGEAAGLLVAPDPDATPSPGADGEAPAPAPADGTPAAERTSEDAPKAAPAADAALGAPVAGTTRDAGASNGVGGVAPALAALAALLTALAVLVARGRVQSTGHR